MGMLFFEQAAVVIQGMQPLSSIWTVSPYHQPLSVQGAWHLLFSNKLQSVSSNLSSPMYAKDLIFNVLHMVRKA